MTASSLAHILAKAGPILLDFDGPVCSIFAGFPAREVSSELRNVFVRAGVKIPEEIAEEADPLQILRWTATLENPALMREIEDALRAAELRAAATAFPTPYSYEVFVAARQTGHRVAIVSNNSAPAIRAYLSRHGLGTYVSYIAGRQPCCPEKMKPHPHSIIDALTALNAQTREGVLIGDSLTDITASREAGTHVVGYANKPGKLESFSAAGADAVVTSLADVSAAI